MTYGVSSVALLPFTNPHILFFAYYFVGNYAISDAAINFLYIH